ncbi:MAG TPA: hypothetical protein DCQ64_26065 [Candidatus Rokubacteria bacterium]|nr:MAG: hypothetical protein A2W26_06275 [Acidobacteria bacterium RBG_16_64_8]HAM58688.1 hypothetical protein [Candidatus Rokubacteria bacterium]
MGSKHESIVRRLVAKAVRFGADTLEIEYRDGHQEVAVLKGGVGFGIARFPSFGVRATSLREELLSLRKRKARVAVKGAEYEIRTRLYESFGETAFEVRLRRI